MFAGGFDGATADGVTCLAEEVIAHTPAIVEEVENGVTHVVRQGTSSGVQEADVVQESAQTTCDQVLFLGGDPRGRLF